MSIAIALYDLKIGGYSSKQIEMDCKILYEAGLISDYKV